MPIVKKCSFSKFVETIQGKKVYVWGASKRLIKQDIYRTPFTHLGPHVYKIVDNNKNLWRQDIEIPFKGMVSIISPKELCEEIEKDDVILIASVRGKEILEQMDNMSELLDIDCYDLADINDFPDSYIEERKWENSLGEDERIPPIIHCCWFGPKAIPQEYLKYIESWRKNCPSYAIEFWNEKNYDVYKHPYMKWAYENQKWEFVSDYARLDLIYSYGGIYFDTDCEMIREPDILRRFSAFVGYESTQIVATGLGVGSERGNAMIGILMAEYDNVDVKGKFDMTPCTLRATRCLRRYGLNCNNSFQILHGGLAILPTEVLCGIRLYTKEKQITKHTISLHHWGGTWGGDKE